MPTSSKSIQPATPRHSTRRSVNRTAAPIPLTSRPDTARLYRGSTSPFSRRSQVTSSFSTLSNTMADKKKTSSSKTGGFSQGSSNGSKTSGSSSKGTSPMERWKNEKPHQSGWSSGTAGSSRTHVQKSISAYDKKTKK